MPSECGGGVGMPTVPSTEGCMHSGHPGVMTERRDI